MTNSEDVSQEDLDLAYRIAGRYGFAIPRSGRSGVTLHSEDRRGLVQNGGLRATLALTELQQWLLDDDVTVREEARTAIARCLHVAYTGGPREPVGLIDRVIIRRLDGLLQRLITKHGAADGPEPFWARPGGVRLVRLAGITLSFLLAVTGMLLIASASTAWALVAIGAAAAFDMAEGSFARSIRAQDAKLRWLSCVVSHLGDILIIVGIAWLESSNPSGNSHAVLLALLISAFASLVRISALQAGFRFWRSPLERIVRFTGVIIYCLANSSGRTGFGLGAVVLLLVAFAACEIARVAWEVIEHPVGRGGFIFLTEDSSTCWSFEEDPVEAAINIDGWGVTGDGLEIVDDLDETADRRN